MGLTWGDMVLAMHIGSGGVLQPSHQSHPALAFSGSRCYSSTCLAISGKMPMSKTNIKTKLIANPLISKLLS